MSITDVETLLSLDKPESKYHCHTWTRQLLGIMASYVLVLEGTTRGIQLCRE